MAYILSFDQVGMNDVAEVGGKNASLGEMLSTLSASGVRVPGGFATTAQAYRDFLSYQGLNEKINNVLNKLDVNDMTALAQAGAKIRQWIMDTPLMPELENQVKTFYEYLQGENETAPSVAVRSSATAEDLPDASFAGQQETYLNIRGVDNVFHAIHKVFASLFTDRAIAYRVHNGFDHAEVALSVGIQKMCRSDLAASGVMFSIDTESGFEDVVFITSSYGVGEMVVQGAVNPDEFYVHKPTLQQGYAPVLRRSLGSKEKKMVFSQASEPGKSVEIKPVDNTKQQLFSINDEEALELAEYACRIEKHYGRPMDIEWGKDGIDGKVYILQARPETVAANAKHQNVIERYHIDHHEKPLAVGRSIGKKIASGEAKVLESVSDINRVQKGDVIVTDMTDPDWEPVMKIASAIVTNRGGRTCHAAIIAREIGVPAVVGCADATQAVQDKTLITVSCAEGDTGYIYQGQVPFDVRRLDINQMPDIPFKIMMNVANPDRAFDFQSTPNHGVGLARLEFIINSSIGYHPKAILHPDRVDENIKEAIIEETKAYGSPRQFYVGKLAEGIAMLAAAFYPKPVIVRMSDFKSNEYANMIGGEYFEPEEENPMIGFRGASRYVSESFRECFAMECEAIKHVREAMGLINVEMMIPFVRTTQEAQNVNETLKANGLERGKKGLSVIMMCEIPTNALIAEKFLEYFDGLSIGSNDMTQLALGLDRDSSLIADQFDERDPGVKALLKMAIQACNRHDKYIGICGQGPSDYPDFADWLVQEGIQSVSLNPDSVIETWLMLSDQYSSS